MIEGLTQGDLQAGGIQIHYVSVGEGPLVVLCHGYPESWYSWRHQLPALAQAGYRAVALDMRGYGGTGKPEAIGAYSIAHLVGDVVGSISALGHGEPAVVIGHDWGAPVTWYTGLMRPDLVRAVACISVPYVPPFALPPELSLVELMTRAHGGKEYYRRYFQQPGVAEAELENDVRATMRGFMYTWSGDIVRDGVLPRGNDGSFPAGESFFEQLHQPQTLPAWLSEADLDFYAKALGESGFRGGLNWYRNLDAMPGILSPFIGRTLQQPTLYLYGEHDLIGGNTDQAIDTMRSALPDLRDIVRLEGAGHWLQQERPGEVNAALLAFLKTL